MLFKVLCHVGGVGTLQFVWLSWLAKPIPGHHFEVVLDPRDSFTVMHWCGLWQQRVGSTQNFSHVDKSPWYVLRTLHCLCYETHSTFPLTGLSEDKWQSVVGLSPFRCRSYAGAAQSKVQEKSKRRRRRSKTKETKKKKKKKLIVKPAIIAPSLPHCSLQAQKCLHDLFEMGPVEFL